MENNQVQTVLDIAKDYGVGFIDTMLDSYKESGIWIAQDWNKMYSEKGIHLFEDKPVSKDGMWSGDIIDTPCYGRGLPLCSSHQEAQYLTHKEMVELSKSLLKNNRDQGFSREDLS